MSLIFNVLNDRDTPSVHPQNSARDPAAVGRQRILFVMLVLGAACLAVYGNTRNAPFVFDDITNITKNPQVRLRNLSPSSLVDIFRNYSGTRPLAHLSFAINYYLHRYDPAGYHAVNWLIHIINGMLVYLLTLRTLSLLKTRIPAAPLCTALLWLVNPVHTQSVTYVVQRMNSLAALFYLTALLLFIRARTLPATENRRKTAVFLYIACIIAGICALSAKENAATLPIMIFMYDWFFIRDLEIGAVTKQLFFLAAIGVAAAVMAHVYLGADPLAAVLSRYRSVPFTMGERLLTEPRVIWHYLSLLLLPLPERLTIDHHVLVSRTLTDPPVTLIALGLLISATALAVVNARRHRLLSFSVFWFLGTLAVESSFIGLDLMFEHRTYLPSVFVFIAVVCTFLRHTRPTRLAIGTLAILIVVSGFWTRQRNALWADEIRFWQDAVRKAPESVRPYNNLGVALSLQRRFEEGIAACKKSIALSAPTINTTDAYNNLAKLYHELGDNEKAVSYGKRAVQINPGCAEAHMVLGEILLDEKRYAEAIDELEVALHINTWLSPAYTLLARAYYRQTGDIDRAADICRRAMAVAPESPEAESLLGALLQHSGNPEQALAHLGHVLEIYPDHAQANFHAGIAANKLGRPEEAIEYLTRASAALPDEAPVLAELGLALTKTGRLNEARTFLTRAVQLAPADPVVLTGLADVMEKTNRFEEAAVYYQKALSAVPESPHSLNQLAVVLTKTGRFDEAAEALNRLEKLIPGAPTVSFNLACLYARQNRPEKAILHLKKAVEKGFDDWAALQTDPDLDSIRSSTYYHHLKNELGK